MTNIPPLFDGSNEHQDSLSERLLDTPMSEIIDYFEQHGYYIIPRQEYDTYVVAEGMTKVRWTGSIKDQEYDELLEELYQQYGARLYAKMQALLK